MLVAQQDVNIYLVGTKVDLVQGDKKAARQVDTGDIQAYADGA